MSMPLGNDEAIAAFHSNHLVVGAYSPVNLSHALLSVIFG